MRFYLTGVAQTAQQATRTARALLGLFARDRDRTLTAGGRAAVSTLRVYEHLTRRVIVSIPRTVAALGMSVPTATAALGRLEALGIAREVTGRAYARQYVRWHQLVGPVIEQVELRAVPGRPERTAFKGASAEPG